MFLALVDGKMPLELPLPLRENLAPQTRIMLLFMLIFE